MYHSAATNISSTGEKDFVENYDDNSYVMINDCMKEYEKLENLDSIRKQIKKACYQLPHEVFYKFFTTRSLWSLINEPIFWCSIGIYTLIRVFLIKDIPKEGKVFILPLRCQLWERL